MKATWFGVVNPLSSPLQTTAVSTGSEAILLTNNTLVCHKVNIDVSLFEHAEN